jgi:hypothetical protein
MSGILARFRGMRKIFSEVPGLPHFPFPFLARLWQGDFPRSRPLAGSSA